MLGVGTAADSDRILGECVGDPGALPDGNGAGGRGLGIATDGKRRGCLRFGPLAHRQRIGGGGLGTTAHCQGTFCG